MVTYMSFTIFSTENTAITFTEVPREQAIREGYRLAEDDRLLTSWNGYRTIATPTGTTRTFFSGLVIAPTFDRFEVETVADEEGVIWGVKAERIVGGRVAQRTS